MTFSQNSVLITTEVVSILVALKELGEKITICNTSKQKILWQAWTKAQVKTCTNTFLTSLWYGWATNQKESITVIWWQRGINNAVNTCTFYRSVDSWRKISQAKRWRRTKHRKDPYIWEYYLFVWKNGSLKPGKYLLEGASIPVVGEGLFQTPAIHTHPAAGSRTHFAIFVLWHTWPCPQVLGIGKPFY